MVDEDDVLQGCKSAVLMLLKPPQQWQPAAVAISPISAGADNEISNALEHSTSANLVNVFFVFIYSTLHYIPCK